MIKLRNIVFLDALFGIKLVTLCYWIMITFATLDHANLLRELNNWRELPSLIFRFFYSLFFTRLAAEILASLFTLNRNVQALSMSTVKTSQNVKPLS